MRGLIIRSPHIDNILAGKKIWEMRSKVIRLRETIALIKAGSGCVVGVADIVDCIGPLSLEQRIASTAKHWVPASQWSDPTFEKYVYAWVLDHVFPFASPVWYTHPKGAQAFVTLEEPTLSLIEEKLKQSPATVSVEPVTPSGLTTQIKPAPIPLPDRKPVSQLAPLEVDASECWVPFADDGTWFHPGLRRPRAGTYTVGEKDDEVQFDRFDLALEYLRAMPVAKWRRPNQVGNWGIVSAVRWAKLPRR